MGDDLGKIKYGGVEWTAKLPNEILLNRKLVGFWDWDYNEDKFKIYFEDYDLVYLFLLLYKLQSQLIWHHVFFVSLLKYYPFLLQNFEQI